jgi:hypothetical protein
MRGHSAQITLWVPSCGPAPAPVRNTSTSHTACWLQAPSGGRGGIACGARVLGARPNRHTRVGTVQHTQYEILGYLEAPPGSSKSPDGCMVTGGGWPVAGRLAPFPLATLLTGPGSRRPGGCVACVALAHRAGPLAPARHMGPCGGEVASCPPPGPGGTRARAASWRCARAPCPCRRHSTAVAPSRPPPLPPPCASKPRRRPAVPHTAAWRGPPAVGATPVGPRRPLPPRARATRSHAASGWPPPLPTGGGPGRLLWGARACSACG